MSPSEFERQGGKGHIKKWRDTLIVDEAGQPQHSLGQWLKSIGIVPPPKNRNAPARVLQGMLAALAQHSMVDVNGRPVAPTILFSQPMVGGGLGSGGLTQLPGLPTLGADLQISNSG